MLMICWDAWCLKNIKNKQANKQANRQTNKPPLLNLSLWNEISDSGKKDSENPYALLLQVIIFLRFIILIKQCNHDNLERTLVLNVCVSLSYCVISWHFSLSLLYSVSLIICIFSNLSLSQTIKLVKCLFLFAIWGIDVWDW